QCDTAVASPLVQLAAPHATVAAADAHRPPAAHAPVFPHGGALPQRESAAPVVTLAHVPLAPPVRAAEHALHDVLHALLQHNPSAQKPDVHWLAAVHVPPVAFLGMQAVPEQKS